MAESWRGYVHRYSSWYSNPYRQCVGVDCNPCGNYLGIVLREREKQICVEHGG